MARLRFTSLLWPAYEGIASAMNLIDDILPWVVLLLGLSLPLLAVWLLV
jgi:hypothetical protein